MSRRICPQEYELSEYMSGALPHDKVLLLEEHLVLCRSCRELLSGTCRVLKGERKYEAINMALSKLYAGRYLLGAFLSLLLSFFVKKYFMQFLVLFLVLGIKFAFSSKNVHIAAAKYADKKHMSKVR